MILAVDSRLVNYRYGGAGPSSAGRQAERTSWLRAVSYAAPKTRSPTAKNCGKHPILSGCVPNNVLSRTPCLAVPLDRRERHVVTAERSDRRPDRRPDPKLDTVDPSRGMPLYTTHILRTWIKYYAKYRSRMPTEPDKHYLLGFPGVEAEKPKCYIRKLWLVADNDRIEFPRFLDPIVGDLATYVNGVVDTFAQDENERYAELCGGAFLENDALHILNHLRFGQRIWGEGPGAEIRLQSNLPGSRPRWGIDTGSGYENNDEDR
jgi:hypothetical protein